MKFVILNGSPKGAESVTMQYILYFKKKHPEHEYNIINIAQTIKKIEDDDKRFGDIINQIQESDGVIWGFPLYVMLVCSQYKRFIELVFEKNAEAAFENKYTIVLSTSIHFYDHTAQNYIQSICDDLNMKYVGNFPADSWDLLWPKRRARWLLFTEEFINHIENNFPTSKHYAPLNLRNFNYSPGKSMDKSKKIDTHGKRVLVVSDETTENTNLGKMLRRFKDSFANEIEIVNINEVDIKGGCISCLQCGYDHKCSYIGKDGFIEFWEEVVMTSDILIFAGVIKDRYLSSKWKMALDRAFYMTHTPTLIGKQMGYIISGPLSQIPNLSEMFQGHIELQGSNLVDIITDEFGTSEEIDALLHDFARRLVTFSKADYIKPLTFLGEGGRKIFRDDIYGRNRFVFMADHEYYEKHGFYDSFPQNDERAKKMNEKLIPLMKIDKVRTKINMKQEFLRPFLRVLEDPNK
ncbi:MAG: NAD(P)H-dependent oxidoreductase [Candidatus Lokiarchaeota archaeon]|nr:NAD(P)H-dependent oxidoreductase [Candidatus Lokiarchaeota archaeon]